VAPESQRKLTAAVLVPTYRRPECLERCITALLSQTHRPNRTVIVARTEDHPTVTELDRLRSLGLLFETALTSTPGKSEAIRAGLTLCRENVVAMVDDDAVATPEWLERLVSQYQQGVGGVGGRDLITGTNGAGALQPVVGRVTWYGRSVGNHHLGGGPARDVDVLKGVNTSFRRELWVIDPGIRGVGAQPNLEIAMCLRARRLGWRLIYDPQAVVLHSPATRYDGGGRGFDSLDFLHDGSFNMAYAYARNLSWLRLTASATYLFAIGSRGEPGILFALRSLLRNNERTSFQAFKVVTRARAEGLLAGLRARIGDLDFEGVADPAQTEQGMR
jgi:GT2 family glycosyltransferase